MKHLFRSPLAWICATIITIALCISAYHFFSQAFPLIQLDITMNLAQALEYAESIAQDNNCGPTPHKSAAQFNFDRTTTTFVELEGGGKDALESMLTQELYNPYTWQVRHFKEFEQNETSIFFTPQGKPYGFIETISENLPGAQLEKDTAQTIAENYASQKWNINFSQYVLVEASKKREPSNRDDHTFVYERPDKQLGEGRYRLRIKVSGDKVTELTHFVKIPETFSRRYANMRSANNTISLVGLLIAFLLFGTITILFFLVKRRWFIWQQPLMWGLFLAITTVFASINTLPSMWMYYNTTTSTHGFLLQMAISWVYSFLFQTCLITGCLIAAETLTNRAFGNQPQLWRLWSTDVASSYALLGRTLGGYLLAGLDVAFVIFFYFISRHLFGWWNPSDPLFDPNILATYVPWFSPLAQALNAGFLEEAIFRAIPLAGAALLGQRFGKKNIWLTVGLIVQALIFGAVHANYPQQPAYARIVEMFVPAFIWGLTYLRFGLLPVIITHVVYDIIWMSLPIFILHAPYALLYKMIIILLSLVPLFIVLYARIQKGIWKELAPSDLNSALDLLEQSVTTEQKKRTSFVTESIPLSHIKRNVVFALGIIGAAAWLLTTPFSHDGIKIEKTKTAAIQQANDYLAHTNILLNESWRTLPLVFVNYSHAPSIDLQHRFIWQQEGKSLYHSLLGTHLEPAHWTIRYAQFEGDIIKRAEEYRIMLANNSVWRAYHKLPESLLGAQLTQNEARPLAHQAIKDRFNLDPTTLQEISAQEIQLPDRKDWLFMFLDSHYELTKGEARVNVLIAGDTIVDAIRLIHVPEEWTRQDLNKQHTSGIVHTILFLMMLFFFIGGLGFLQMHQVRPFPIKIFFCVYFSLLTIFILNFMNAWPSLIGAFNTSEPFSSQLIRLFSSQILSYILRAGLFAGALVYISIQRTTSLLPRTLSTYMLGICGGMFLAGTSALMNVLMPSLQPLWPDYTPLNAYIPIAESIANICLSYIYSVIPISLFFAIITHATRIRKIDPALVVLLCIIFELTYTNIHPMHTLIGWLLTSSITGLALYGVYRALIRFDSTLIILIMAIIAILNTIQEGIFNAYQGAACASALTIIALIACAALWFTYVCYEKKEKRIGD